MDFSGTLRNEGRLPTVPRYVDTPFANTLR